MTIGDCLKKICMPGKRAVTLTLLLALILLASAGCGAGDTSAARAVPSAESAQPGQELTDGTYQPESFTWSGGSGKTDITCPYFTVTDGEACARIVFNSAFYEYVKLDGKMYDPVHEDGTSAFDIPLPLNTEVPVTAMTTAMSSPHEITYTVAVWYGKLPPETPAGGKPYEEISGPVNGPEQEGAQSASAPAALEAGLSVAPDIPGLEFEYELPLSFATHFRVFYYSDGYRLLSVSGSGNYLCIPKGAAVPAGADEDMIIIRSPSKIYMAATAVMSLFDRLNAIDDIAFSGSKKEDWTIPDAVKAMDDGRMVYAGSYSEPDYELLLSGDCDLAIESTMIFHMPKVQEMLTRLGIPVLVDHSSYEDDPLGRTEWIKFYGALMGKDEEAAEWFDAQYELVRPLLDLPDTGKSVAVFYLASDGTVVVRSAGDYIPAMIEMAGGRYVFDDLYVPTGSGPSVKLSMEEFYATAADADYLIYNGTIDEQVKSLSDLLEKSSLLADLAAVQNGNVWKTGRDLYQATDTTGNMILDLHLMLTGGAPEEMTFLEKLE